MSRALSEKQAAYAREVFTELVGWAKRTGKTQSWVGEQVGVDQSGVSAIAKGKRGTSPGPLIAAARLIGRPEEEIASVLGMNLPATADVADALSLPSDPHERAIAMARVFALENNIPRYFVERFDATRIRGRLSSEQIFQIIKAEWLLMREIDEKE